jgi:hypothetical protein
MTSAIVGSPSLHAIKESYGESFFFEVVAQMQRVRGRQPISGMGARQPTVFSCGRQHRHQRTCAGSIGRLADCHDERAADANVAARPGNKGGENLHGVALVLWARLADSAPQFPLSALQLTCQVSRTCPKPEGVFTRHRIRFAEKCGSQFVHDFWKARCLSDLGNQTTERLTL